MKITGLPARVTALLTDIVAIVDAASGTPATWKATLAQVRAVMFPASLTADVSGTLPAANGGLGAAAGAFTGLLKFAAGVASASALVDADVNAAAAIAGSKVAPNFGAQNITTTGVVGLGAAPSVFGDIRLSVGGAVTAHDSAASYYSLITGSGDSVYVGTNPAWGQQATALNLYAANNVAIGTTAVTAIFVSTSGPTELWKPVTGSGSGSSPWGVHGTVLSAMTNADYVVPASEYMFQEIVVPATLTLTAAHKVQLPTPADEAHSYTKELVNLNAGAFALTITRADGLGVTASIAQNFKGTVRVRPAGVYLCSPVSAAP